MENNQKELILLQDLGYLYPKETSKEKKRYGIYRCYCGLEFKAQIQSIKNGHTKSCGCLQKKHGLKNHRLYATWSNMIARCNNPKSKSYQCYGARGIKICERWLDINNFIDDMSSAFIDGLEIDRINPNGNYEPSNCRWATRTVQTRNTRRIYSHNTSGFRGVSFHRKINKWTAYITVDNKRIHLGLFSNPLDGALAYDKYVSDNNLEHTKNF